MNIFRLVASLIIFGLVLFPILQKRAEKRNDLERYRAKSAAEDRAWQIGQERRSWELNHYFAELDFTAAKRMYELERSAERRIALGKARAVVALSLLDWDETEAKRDVSDPEKLRQIEREYDRRRDVIKIQAP